MDPQNPDVNQGGAVATVPAPSEGTQNQPAANSNQPAAPAAGDPNVGTQQVDSGEAGAGNSGQGQPNQQQGDGSQGDGTAVNGDGGAGARQPRSQRRISELAKEANNYRQQADDFKAENERLKTLLADPITPSDIAGRVQLPDRSKQQSLSWDEYKQDVVKAATDIADALVKQRMAQIIPETTRDMTIRQYRTRAYDEMQTAMSDIPELNEDDENHYDPELSTEIAQDFKRIFDADPTYRFSDHVKKYFRGRGGRAQPNTNPSGGRQNNPSTPALRQTGQSSGNRANKPIAAMTASEYKEYLDTQKSTRR